MNPVDARAVRLVDLLPASAITQLVMGPIPPEDEDKPDHYVAACRVCVALEHMVFGKGWPGKEVRAAVYLWDWHHCSQLSAGGRWFDFGNCPEGYRRCLVIYRAAGWPG